MEQERRLQFRQGSKEQMRIKAAAMGDMICGVSEAGIGFLLIAGGIAVEEFSGGVRTASIVAGIVMLLIAAVTVSDYFRAIVFYEEELIYYENFTLKKLRIAYKDITVMKRVDDFLKNGKKAPFYKIYASGKIYSFKYSDFKELEDKMMEVQDALRIYQKASSTKTEEK